MNDAKAPACAMAMARRDSVTVSMADDRIGRFNSMSEAMRVAIFVCPGMISECPGCNRTSSKVRASKPGSGFDNARHLPNSFRIIEMRKQRQLGSGSAGFPFLLEVGEGWVVTDWIMTEGNSNKRYPQPDVPFFRTRPSGWLRLLGCLIPKVAQLCREIDSIGKNAMLWSQESLNWACATPLMAAMPSG